MASTRDALVCVSLAPMRPAGRPAAGPPSRLDGDGSGGIGPVPAVPWTPPQICAQRGKEMRGVQCWPGSMEGTGRAARKGAQRASLAVRVAMEVRYPGGYLACQCGGAAATQEALLRGINSCMSA